MEYIYADSTNRDLTQYPNANAYVLYLTTILKVVHTVKLLTAKIPNTVYNLTNGSNVFSFNSQSYSILPGFYSAYGLAIAMQATTAGSLTVSYLEDQAKFIFSAASNFTMRFNTSEIQLLTGMTLSSVYTSSAASTNPVYQNDTTYSSKYILLSDIVVDMTALDCAFLDIEEFRNSQVIDSKSLSSVYRQTFLGNSVERVTAIIPLDVDSGKIKTFKERTDFTLTVKMNTPLYNINKLTIRWIDKNGNIINFNGYNNNSFVLEITC
jgi:hypothetical protein